MNWKWKILIALVGNRILIFFLSLALLTVIYIIYRRVFVPRDRLRSKTIEAIIPTLECIGVFDEQVVTANQTTVTYKANRQFGQHFTALKSMEDYEKAKVTLFRSIEDKLKETLTANPAADLSKYESAFGITIVNVASGSGAGRDQEAG